MKQNQYEQYIKLFLSFSCVETSRYQVSFELGHKFNIYSRWIKGSRTFYWEDFIHLAKYKGWNIDHAISDSFKVLVCNDLSDKNILLKMTTVTNRKDQVYQTIGESKYYKVLRGVRKLRFDEFLGIANSLTGYLPKFFQHFLNKNEVHQIFTGEVLTFSSFLNKESILILSLVELDSYRALNRHSDKFIADHLEINIQIVKTRLIELEDCGLIVKNKNRLYEIVKPGSITITNKQDSIKVHNIWRNEIYNTAILKKNNKKLIGAYIQFNSSYDLDNKIVELNNRYYNDLRLLVNDYEKKRKPTTHNRVISIDMLDLIESL